MLCPLKFNAPNESWSRNCEKEKCAWWVKSNNNCAVLNTSNALLCINENLNEIEIDLDNIERKT
jgi:hypothetical protein